MIKILTFIVSNHKLLETIGAPKPLGCTFQAPATTIMSAIIELHHTLLYPLIMITILILVFLWKTITEFSFNRPIYKYPNFKWAYWYKNHAGYLAYLFIIFLVILLFKHTIIFTINHNSISLKYILKT